MQPPPPRRHALLVLAVAAALAAAVLPPRPAAAQERSITVASTTSTEQSGLFAHILPLFTQQTGIAVRVGHHCAQPLHRRLGATASTRASAAVHTTREEVDAVVEGVTDAVRFFGVGA